MFYQLKQLTNTVIGLLLLTTSMNTLLSWIVCMWQLLNNLSLGEILKPRHIGIYKTYRLKPQECPFKSKEVIHVSFSQGLK